MKLEFSRQTFKKSETSSFIKMHPVLLDGRTDGHDEANSRFSQFRESA